MKYLLCIIAACSICLGGEVIVKGNRVMTGDGYVRTTADVVAYTNLQLWLAFDPAHSNLDYSAKNRYVTNTIPPITVWNPYGSNWVETTTTYVTNYAYYPDLTLVSAYNSVNDGYIAYYEQYGEGAGYHWQTVDGVFDYTFAFTEDRGSWTCSGYLDWYSSSILFNHSPIGKTWSDQGHGGTVTSLDFTGAQTTVTVAGVGEYITYSGGYLTSPLGYFDEKSVEVYYVDTDESTYACVYYTIADCSVAYEFVYYINFAGNEYWYLIDFSQSISFYGYINGPDITGLEWDWSNGSSTPFEYIVTGDKAWDITVTETTVFHNNAGTHPVWASANVPVAVLDGEYWRRLLCGTNAFTMAFWSSSANGYYGMGVGNDPYQYAGIGPDNMQLMFQYAAPSWPGIYYGRNMGFMPVVNNGSWWWICATYTGSKNVSGVLLYTNGYITASPYYQVSGTPSAIAWGQNYTLSIGRPSYNVSGFVGTMDEPMVWDRVLTSNEVSRMYQLTKERARH